MWRTTNVSVVFVALVAGCVSPGLAGERVPAARPPAGPVIGVVLPTSSGGTADGFLGIPYAETTAGPNRWRPPVPKAPWKKPIAATAGGPICPQLGAGLPPQSEDCLSLNIYAPTGAKPGDQLPVMVFLHPGNFDSGGNAGAAFSWWDGRNLAEAQNVIVVSANYRIGALGFLVTDELPGNFGLLDQQLALKWVRANISAFGGNAQNVTLFGESAGAISVALHSVSMPSSESLFDKAIIESNLPGFPLKNPRDARAFGQIFETSAGVTTTDALRALTVEQILTAQGTAAGLSWQALTGLDNLAQWGPVIDGGLVVRTQMEGFTGGFLTKPTILGYNAEEGYLFVDQWGIAPSTGPGYTAAEYSVWAARGFGVFAPEVLQRYPTHPDNTNAYPIAQLLSDYAAAAPSWLGALGTPTSTSLYLYRFDHVSSFDLLCCADCLDHVCHVAELPYVFNSFAFIAECPPSTTVGLTTTADELALSAQIGQYWTNFARTGDPNQSPPGATAPPVWTPFTAQRPSQQLLNVQTTSSDAPPTNYEFWRGVGYDLYDMWAPQTVR